MRFSIDQVEAFVLVARHGSFSAAARAMQRSQSTVSVAIANLEIALDTELFDRSTRRPSLTAAGEAMLLEAQALYDRSVSFERHGDALAEGVPTSVTLAVAAPHALIQPVLTAFAARFPHTDVRLRNPAQGDAAAAVLRGEASVGVAFAVPDYDETLAFHQLGKVIMAHIAHRDHPLAQIARPSFDDLRAHRRIAYDAHARALPTSEYLQSVQTWTADSYEALISLARSGVGWATLPRLLVREELRSGRLVELALEAYPHTDWIVSVDLLWQRRRRLDAAESWLVDAFRRLKISETSPFGQSTTR
ncbi:LysR family transcriptional regulator [Isoptericola sp. NPDC056618]|uniref:LysR family transcriptional regulator n=1 Tax=unclassified Isoptericola TaxID=2623355 RepID=UPI003659BA8C